jgi:hypothetical protein
VGIELGFGRPASQFVTWAVLAGECGGQRYCPGDKRRRFARVCFYILKIFLNF